VAAIFDSFDDPQLIKLLKDGAVGALPTDTVYGLVCDASNKEAVKKLYSLKNRKDKQGTLIASNIDQLAKLGFKTRYLKAVEHFWPGAVSVETPSSEQSTAHLRQNQPSIAVRIPADKKVSGLLSKTGALLTSSANMPGQEPAKNVQEAEVYFGANVDFYVDGGQLKDKKPSTLIRMVDDAIEVIREGAVKIDEKTGKIVK
jgi:L-threonylcarbamoyladenylate synthase